MIVPIYKPYESRHSKKYVNEAVESNWISSQGKFLDSCKERFKEKFNSDFVIFTNNGTSATHLLAIGLKYKHPNIKKLVVPNSVYVAAWNAFKMSTDYEFIVLPPDLETWNADFSVLDNLNISPEDTAFLIVHNVGNIINVPLLKRKYKDFVFLEDNCEGFTGRYETLYSGKASMAFSVSFFANKTITSGEGGAFVTDDEDLFLYLNSVKNQGVSSKRYVFDKMGYNYRLTNLAAAVLQGQLEDIDVIKYLKSETFSNYKRELATVEEVALQKVEDDTVHSDWMFAIKLLKSDRELLSNFLFENGYESRPMFPPMNHHKHYSHVSQCDKAEVLYNQCIMLPSFPTLSKGQVKQICFLIKEFYK
tara:strand:- start:937 stop:2025 length:1089 start_codon:yes stop_codon:yes gene_type:complete